jgi:hypothetical protein
MIYLIRNSDRTIKTFMERGEDYMLQPGESMEVLAGEFADYAARLRIAFNGVSGETIKRYHGSGDVSVQVLCPGQSLVDIEVNGVVETLALINGAGQLVLSAEVPGTFFIQPTDRVNYCAAGEVVLTVVIL